MPLAARIPLSHGPAERSPSAQVEISHAKIRPLGTPKHLLKLRQKREFDIVEDSRHLHQTAGEMDKAERSSRFRNCAIPVREGRRWSEGRDRRGRPAAS